MPVQIVGLDKIQRELKSFDFAAKKIQTRFLTLIGELTVEALKNNVPVDTGALRDSFSYSISKNTVDVFSTEADKLNWIDKGTKPHIIEPVNTSVLRFEIDGQEIFASRVYHPGTKANPIYTEISNQMNNMILTVLEQAMSENHEFFKGLPGGKGRKYQQVGRTSAGFSGGISFAGRSTLQRPGLGRKTLRRRGPYLRRRRGKSINPSRKDVKLG